MIKGIIILRMLIFVGIITCLTGCNLLKPTFPKLDPQLLTPNQVKTLASLKKINDHPLYIMNYLGDYTWCLKLKQKYYKQLGLPRPKCSTFAALNLNGAKIFGRNNDNLKVPVLLLFTYPPNGYASVSMLEIGDAYGCFYSCKQNMIESTEARTTILYSPYFISDGMNEFGLAVGDMSVPGAKASIDSDKETIFDGEAKRYLLDHAKNVDEAITILSKYNIILGNYGNHLLIADRTGKSVVVEWVNGEMKVIRNTEPWQAATNFMLNGSGEKIKGLAAEYHKTGKILKDINGLSYWRYLTACDTLQKTNGLITSGEAMDLLKKISLTPSKAVIFPTQWSVVYNMSSGDIKVAMGRNYQQIYELKLKLKE